MEIRQFRKAAGLTSVELASVLRRFYPGADKYLVSKLENPERYGIRLTPEAERKLKALFPSVRTRQSDRHKKRRTVTVRFTEEEYLRLQQRLRDGETVTEFILKELKK